MLKFIGNTLDRVLFAINMVVAMQLPGFIQQYGQRLAGHLDEAKYQLANYQYIADQHYQGDIQLLVKRYQTNSDPGINAAGDLVFELIERISLLTAQVEHLFNRNFFSKIYYFIIEIDLAVAQATLRDYQLSIPLDKASLLIGFVFAVVVSLVSAFSFKLIQRST
ncbi:DUF2937 family protein [Thalassotalea sp. ND16A]|uniref:DUF2937 family protein n=1 Tax=Thalassotalea sp. ND16A TaxID=1535422 RepID=UPI00051A15BF|nr:DUF2937 family protein [Thalassotalea sp. ND16A]KGJ98720.1 hypothetical protein ND16A_0523 [Thalassotalea sp. ND16A]